MAELKQVPFTTNMSSNLPDPKTWAKEKKMSEVDQAEHNRNIGNPLTAYAREEAKTEADLEEAAKEAGIDVVEDPTILERAKAWMAKTGKSFEDWLAENEVEGEPQTSGDLPNPTGEQLITDDFDFSEFGDQQAGYYDKEGNYLGDDEAAAEAAAKSHGDDSFLLKNWSEMQDDFGGGSGGDEEPEKKATKYKVKSIMDAFYDGDIDENTRNFMIADTIAKFLRNTGKDIGNIGAQYTGGAIDDSREESLWDERNKEMAKQGISAEAATVEGSDKNIERQLQQNVINSGKLSNEQKEYIVGAARQINTMMKNAKTNTEKQALAQLQAALATGNVNMVTGIGGAVAGLLGGDGKSIINEMLETIRSW